MLFLQEVSKALSEQSEDKFLQYQHFDRVILQDSTQIRLPKQNSEHYKGISNQWGEKSSVKMGLIKDALSGEVIHSSTHDGTYQDRNLAKDLYSFVLPRDLVLRDMGYFSSSGLAIIDQ